MDAMMKNKQMRRPCSLAYGSKENTSHADSRRRRRSWNSPLKASPSPSSEARNDGVAPLYTFGVLTDIQYAPIPDGRSYSGNPRYYRHAKEAAEYAAIHFQEEQVQCVVNLGDIIDGKCAAVEKWGGAAPKGAGGGGTAAEEEKKTNEGGGVGHDAIDGVLRSLSWYYAGPILHTYGNHELYNLSRWELSRKLSIPFKLEPTNDLVGYYDHLLHRTPQSMKLRFLVVDSYDICLLDRCPDTSRKRRAAHEIMLERNPNYPAEPNSPAGLEGLDKRFVAFNGGVDRPQLEWLERSLQRARDRDERVILCSHQPIHPGSTWPTCLIWNYDEILAVIRRYGDVVLASFSGHAHKGGYVRDEMSGVHFRTFEAVLESPDPVRTYAMVDVHEDRLVVRGWGDCESDVYSLDHLDVGADDVVAHG